MRGSISEEGILCIYRSGRFCKMMCPHNRRGDSDFYCDHWCPLFGEPSHLVVENTEFTEIQLCQKTLIFHEFEDHRK
jgi:hypothetical protein